MILPGHSLADGRLHETRQRWQNVDWWVDLSVMQLTVYVYLSLGNVTSQIGNWMGNIIVGHSQNGDLSNGTVTALYTAGTLVNGGQIGVHVTWETTTAGHFFSGGWYLEFKLRVHETKLLPWTEIKTNDSLNIFFLYSPSFKKCYKPFNRYFLSNLKQKRHFFSNVIKYWLNFVILKSYLIFFQILLDLFFNMIRNLILISGNISHYSKKLPLYNHREIWYRRIKKK